MKTKNKYTVDYFIKKFTAIPVSKWTIAEFHNNEHTKFCALGHCGLTEEKQNGEEGDALFELFSEHNLWVDIVNDIPDGQFLQKTPRGRILAALRWIKKEQKKKV